MKRILYILLLLIVSFTLKSQVTPVTGGYPITQNIGSINTLVRSPGGALGGNLVVWRYTDTVAANLTQIKNYPFAIIATTNDNSLWTRNKLATQWMQGSGTIDIDNFEFLNDSTLIICFGNGTCDTISMFNFNTVVNNLIQNFLDSSVINIGDSILIICNQAGSCDTININAGDNYFFLNDSTIVVCDSLETICVGDSCYVQQICDTIPVPKITSLQFDEGIARITPGSNVVKLGDDGSGWARFGSTRQIDAYAYNLILKGRAVGLEPLGIQQEQLPGLSSSIQSWHHRGSQTVGQSDYFNSVKLSVNYTDRLYADSIGFMYHDIGYMLMTNSIGNSYHYTIANTAAKQTGIMLHTTDTSNNRAVTIFGNQVPSAYGLANNPQVDSTLFDSRIAVFKTNGQVQLPQYDSTGAFEYPTPTYIIGQDSVGNLVQFPPGGAGGGLLLSADNGLSVRSSTVAVLGQNVAEAGNPAILLSHREIPMGGFTLSLNASATQSANIFQTKNAAAAIRARITAAASFSNTGGQTGSEVFGDGATVTGNNSTVIGFGSTATTGSIVIGSSASETGGSNIVLGGTVTSVNPGTVLIGTGATSDDGSNVVIGSTASSSGIGQSVVIGATANSSGANTIAIGTGASADHEYSQVYGFGTSSTAANQWVVGSSIDIAGGVNDAYFGRGVTSTAANNFKMQPTGASGSDVAGNTFIIAGGKRTGNSTTGGDIEFQTSNAGASGTTLQSLTTKAILSNSVFGIGITSSFTATRLDVVDNSVADDRIVSITSTSTAADDNAQIGVYVALSGANAVTTQSTNGIYSSNTHTGTSSTNYAIQGFAQSGTTNYGVYGVTGGTGAGVYGSSNADAGYGGYFTHASSATGATTKIALYANNNASGSGGTINIGGQFAASAGTNNYALIVPAASGNIGFGTSAPSAQALLELVSTTQAFIVMRMTAAQASAITAANGMILYVTDTDATFTSVGFWGREAGAWVKL